MKNAWGKTQVLRKRDLEPVENPRKKRKTATPNLLSSGGFVDKWSALKTALGYELILLDFNAWFPEASIISERKLDNLVHKLYYRLFNPLQGSTRTPRFSTEINALKALIDSDNTSNNVKTASKLRILAYLLPPTNRANSKNHTTVVDAHQSMVLHVKVRYIITDNHKNLSRRQ